jgi:hypothetical protein
MKSENQLIWPVLKVLEETHDGQLPTGQVRKRVRETIHLTPSDLAPLPSRSDQRIDQIIRNLKSHKTAAGNPFAEGLLEDVPRGFKLTEAGRRMLERHTERGRGARDPRPPLPGPGHNRQG